MISIHDFKIKKVYLKGSQLEMIIDMSSTFVKGVYTVESASYSHFMLKVIKDNAYMTQTFQQPHVNISVFNAIFRPVTAHVEGLKL